MELRDYQRRCVDALAAYFRDAATPGLGAGVAFYKQTNRAFVDVPGMANMPYVCLRVPTGGGKTLLACHAIDVAAREFLRSSTPTVLWLAPSNAIVGQTLRALRDRAHGYRRALDEKFAGNVRVLDLSEALAVTKPDLDGALCVIVTTFQALRVDNTEGRKVYESSGAMQPHIDALPPGERARFADAAGVVTYSLANVLTTRRPLVIMDEAHNARTALSFDTLARFNPSAIVEFTATPEREHDPARGTYASNILAHVSAAELKAEHMVKLPVRLRVEADWRLVVRDALDTRRQLAEQAAKERAATGEYIRPIVLFQAQSVNGDDVNVERLRQALVDDFKVPADQVAIHTGASRGLDGVDVMSERCPITCIVTVKALVEGWDCPFAYVLCTVSAVGTPRAVEQVLGRVLRLPGAKRKTHEALNGAYAFAASDNFIATATNLRDALVEGAGFQRLEAKDLVVDARADEAGLFDRRVVPLGSPPRLSALPADLRERVRFEPTRGELVVDGTVTQTEANAIAATASTPADREAVARVIRPAVAAPPANLAADRSPMVLPGLSVRHEGEWTLFDDTLLLDTAWELATCDPTLDEATFASDAARGMAGTIDVTGAGRVELADFATVDFVRTLHRDLSMYAAEPGWTVDALTRWMLPKVRQIDTSASSLRSFTGAAIEGLMRERHWAIDRVAAEKFRLAESINRRIDQHRDARRAQTYERLLFAEGAAVEASPERALTLDPAYYSPNWYYEGPYRFARHVGRVGELKGDGEEYECAVWIDGHAQVKRWLRNIDRRPQHSFWLQTSTDRFYPDFVAEVGNERWLVVEYKGKDRWTDDDSREKRRLGELWAARSGGRCAFAMPQGIDRGPIEAAIASLT